MGSLYARTPGRRSFRHGVRIALAGFALGGLLLGTTPSDASATGGARAAASWQTVWRDDFTGPAGAGPSGTNWLVDLGRSYPGGPDQWGTGELETYTADPGNLSLDGRGNLRITATRSPAGTWRSARIETVRSDFAPAPGGRLRIEARIQLPGGGKGYWPAFWAIGAPFRTDRGAWPSAGELDVMENINNQSTVHGTVHCGLVEEGGPCHEDTGLTGGYRLGAASAGAAGFHVYSLVWNTSPQRLDWYVDNSLYWSVTATTMGATTWRDTFDHGYFVLLNLAIGGGWPGSPNVSTQPGQSMLVDYVAVSRGSGPQ